MGNIKLPPLHILPRVLAGDYYHELLYLAGEHPPCELRGDASDVGLDLVVARDEHVQAVFFDVGEVFGRVDAALEENGVDAVVKEFRNHFGRAFEGELMRLLGVIAGGGFACGRGFGAF